MDKASTQKITRFYLDITEKSEEEIKELLIASRKATRYFTLKSDPDRSIKKTWEIKSLTRSSNLYNNVATDSTFKENENNLQNVDIVIHGPPQKGK